MIELQALTIANEPKRPLITGQTLSLTDGTLTALIGRNGCGKSTLLRVISGEQKPLEGKVIINDTEISHAAPRKLAEMIAVITTESVKVSNLTCRELVSYGRAPHTGLLGRLNAADKKIIDHSLRLVGMTQFANRPVSRISDGESRRIMLARALAQQTPVIILDEPTSFLDVPGRYEIAALLAQLAHNEHKTILYSTHELEPAFLHSDNIILMQPTGLLQLPPEQMKVHPDYLKLFSINQ